MSTSGGTQLTQRHSVIQPLPEQNDQMTQTLSEDISVLTFAAWAHEKNVPKAGWLLFIVLAIQYCALLLLVVAYEAEDHSPGVITYQIVDVYDHKAHPNYLLNNSANSSSFNFNAGFLTVREFGDAPGTQWGSSAFYPGMVVSLCILAIYISQESYGQILLFFAPNHVDIYKPYKKMIKWVSSMNLCATYLAWSLCLRYCFYYSGDAFPTNIILVPIGIVFVLEVDEWAAKLLIFYYDHINREDVSELCKITVAKQQNDLCKRSWYLFLVICFAAVPTLYLSMLFIQFCQGTLTPMHDQEPSDNFIWGRFAWAMYISAIVGLIGHQWILRQLNDR